MDINVDINVDITIIGGGFFGLYLAEYFSRLNKKVLVIEKENDAMQRASYNNQARVHNGYHYPRSVLTALRSRISFPRFVDEFKPCIDNDFDKYYMISNRLGKITPNQFQKFCDRIGATHESAPPEIQRLIQPNMIDGIFKVKEFAFDSVLLKKTMLDRIQNSGVDILFNHNVKTIKQHQSTSRLELKIDSDTETINISSKQVYNCTYSLLNSVLNGSNIELIPLRHEMTEMCVVDVPDELKKVGITVMCGPFFSVMPFPSKQAHSFSHVRYTPHYEWDDNNQSPYVDAHKLYSESFKRSAWKKMKLDAQRYIPILADVKYKESLWEVKTILPRSETDDSRPILFKANYGLPGLHCVMGGKIDNIYDVIQTINNLGLDV
ncbi:FAD dependent oxidoreductase [Psychromonas ingrahamii 37]|uniref:FAD dependent oxidoreductase n=1 Tax=Psychromonas ingrahamii (strain DSM 17664 / CCUG 51855 / 37) TaxID=357804 RepID=A1SS43_PSYIN|nr:FAD-dependent oxidoreductase [Psychromonas ingrahamii]ABM02308.1 FAD dependent oxidoreductase [Psychromonas ingrahamii 37]